jgi:hypothetical protein
MADYVTDTAADHTEARKAGREQLRRALTRVRSGIRLSRGRGGQALDAVLRAVAGTGTLDDGDEGRLALVIESLTFAVEDAETRARRPRLR